MIEEIITDLNSSNSGHDEYKQNQVIDFKINNNNNNLNESDNDIKLSNDLYLLAKQSNNTNDNKSIDEIIELEKQSEKLLDKVSKLNKDNNSIHNNTLSASFGVLTWYKIWKNKKRECKIQVLYNSLLPKLKSTADKLQHWLTSVSDRKSVAIHSAFNLYRDMESAVEICQSHVDIYDDILNDCLQIGCDLKKEMVDLKMALEFGREVIKSKNKRVQSANLKRSDSHDSKHKRPPVPDKIMLPSSKPLTPYNPNVIYLPSISCDAAVWHGYNGNEGKYIYDSKTATNEESKQNQANHSHMLENISISMNPFNMKHLDVDTIFHHHDHNIPANIYPSNSPTNNSNTNNLIGNLKHFVPNLNSKSRIISTVNNHSECSQISRSRSISLTSNTSNQTKSLYKTSTVVNSDTSLNSLLVDFNTKACTNELEILYNESNKLLNHSNDQDIKRLINRMERLHGLKDSVAALIEQIKLSRDETVTNKKKCKKLRDELETLISQGVALSNEKKSSLTLDNSQLSKVLSDHGNMPTTPIRTTSLHSDHESVSSHNEMTHSNILELSSIESQSDNEHNNSLVLRTGSNDLSRLSKRPLSSRTTSTAGSVSDEVLSDHTRLIATECVDELKLILMEESMIRQKLTTVEHLIESTADLRTIN